MNRKSPIADMTDALDAYGAIYPAGNNAYHYVRALQRNSLDAVVNATSNDIRRETPGLSEIDAKIQACLEVKSVLAAAAGNGRGKRVRDALASKKPGPELDVPFMLQPKPAA